MKKIFLPLVGFLLFGFQLNAQSTQQSLRGQYIHESAEIMCNCINNSFSSLEEMADETSEKWIEFQTCIGASEEGLKEKYAEIENDPTFNDEIYGNLLIEELSQMEGCELAHTLILMSAASTSEESGEHK
jgi:hypothetical protein